MKISKYINSRLKIFLLYHSKWYFKKKMLEKIEYLIKQQSRLGLCQVFYKVLCDLEGYDNYNSPDLPNLPNFILKLSPTITYNIYGNPLPSKIKTAFWFPINVYEASEIEWYKPRIELLNKL